VGVGSVEGGCETGQEKRIMNGGNPETLSKKQEEKSFGKRRGPTNKNTKVQKWGFSNPAHPEKPDPIRDRRKKRKNLG